MACGNSRGSGRDFEDLEGNSGPVLPIARLVAAAEHARIGAGTDGAPAEVEHVLDGMVPCSFVHTTKHDPAPQGNTRNVRIYPITFAMHTASCKLSTSCAAAGSSNQ